MDGSVVVVAGGLSLTRAQFVMDGMGGTGHFVSMRSSFNAVAMEIRLATKSKHTDFRSQEGLVRVGARAPGGSSDSVGWFCLYGGGRSGSDGRHVFIRWRL